MCLISIWFINGMSNLTFNFTKLCSCQQEIFRNLLLKKITTNLSQATCMSISDQAAVFAPVQQCTRAQHAATNSTNISRIFKLSSAMFKMITVFISMKGTFLNLNNVKYICLGQFLLWSRPPLKFNFQRFLKYARNLNLYGRNIPSIRYARDIKERGGRGLK